VTLPGLSALIAGAVTVLLALWISHLILIWIVLATLIYSLAIPFLVQRFLDPIAIAIEESENAFTEEISSAAHAMVEAEVFGYAELYQERLKEKIATLMQLEKKNFLRTSFLQALNIFIIGATLATVATTVYRSDELLPIQISMAVFLVLVGFEGYTSWFPNLFPAGKNRRATQSVDTIINSEITIEATGSLPSSLELELKSVIPYWNKKMLAPISFTITPGEVVVISGASGVGKSTLAAALFGLADFEGEISVGGVPLASLDNPSDQVTGTLQNGHIFNTTLRENLKIANAQATDEELQRTIDLLELNSIGLDEVLGELGRTLSGGEAKRLSVARALLTTAPILILDEPLEHLDFERSLRIQVAIAHECRNRALIVITHAPWLQYSRKLELTRE
jgi:ATP-binding cassette subfamily C protein CydC